MIEEIDCFARATNLTVAWLADPNTPADEANVDGLFQPGVQNPRRNQAGSGGARAERARRCAAVPVRKSHADPNFIIPMIDGKRYLALRRHLTNNNLCPDEYRRRYILRIDDPMVAPAYYEQWRAMARKLGLGREPAERPASLPPTDETRSSHQSKRPSKKRQSVPDRAH